MRTAALSIFALSAMASAAAVATTAPAVGFTIRHWRVRQRLWFLGCLRINQLLGRH